MIEVDQKYKDLFNEYGGKSIKLTFFKDEYYALYPSETLYPSDTLYPAEMSEDSIAFEITDDSVRTDTLSITESLTTDENLSFGDCEASQFEVTVSGLDRDIFGKEFLVSESFGDYTLSLGLYTVDSTPKQEDRDTRKIIAYDRMKRFDCDVSGWYNTLEFPMTQKELRDSLCAFVGVAQEDADLINDDIQIEKTIQPSTLNGRDFLRYICQINGVFGNINKSGRLRYISIPKSDDILSEVKIYQSAESEEYSVPDIDTVRIREEEGDIGASSSGDGNNVYIIEGNPLVYGKSTSELVEIANKIKNAVSGLSYVPANIVTNGDPWREVGDRIKVTTSDGTINMIVMSRVFTGIQGAMDDLSSTGSQELSQPFNVSSEIIQLKGLSAILKRTIEEVSNELTNLEEETTSKFVQTAAQISAEVERATAAENTLSGRITVEADRITAEVTARKKGEVQLQSQITQTATQIRSEVSNVKEGLQSQITQTATEIRSEVTNSVNGLSSRITQNTNQIALKVSKGEVSSQISVESGGVNITGNRFSWSATNSSMTADGTLTCKNIKATNGRFSGNITGSSITGSTIEIGPFYVDESEIALGDFFVSVDSSYQFRSTNGTVSLETSNTPGGSVATLILRNESGSNYAEIQGGNPTFSGIVSCKAVYDTAKNYSQFYDIYPGKSWWDGWSLTETVQDLWEQVDSLSDETEKDNITNIDEEEAMAIILGSRPVSFQYKRDGKWSIGMIAQEVEALEDEEEIYFPLVRTDRRSGKYCINYTGYIPLLIATIKNMQNQINEMKGTQ